MKLDMTSPQKSPRHPGLGAALLAVSLIAGPGLATPAAAVEAAPTATPAETGGSTVPQAQAATATPTASPAPAPATATPMPTASASTAQPTAEKSTEAYRSAMAEATKTGGGGDGTGTRADDASPDGDKAAGTEALATEGTWMPSFGVQGLDVSKYQAGINWQTEWNMGARFAYIKATEGNYYTSTTFSDQYLGSRAVGMIRGAYHFANPAASSGADQARSSSRTAAAGRRRVHHAPRPRLEGNPYAGQTIGGYYQGNTCYDMTPAQLTSWARDFGSTMQALTGRLPVMYTTTTWWNYCVGGPSGFGDWPLWIARWPSSPSDSPAPCPPAGPIAVAVQRVRPSPTAATPTSGTGTTPRSSGSRRALPRLPRPHRRSRPTRPAGSSRPAISTATARPIRSSAGRRRALVLPRQRCRTVRGRAADRLRLGDL